ncbi:MAG TPA: ABC transporter permease, partial [Gemmatimonadales bacterium]|nr:ABC transporter permease [Gemmatimonadales bacterium]
AIFTVVDAVLLQPLPYQDPGHLVDVNHFYPSLNNLRASVSAPGYQIYHGHAEIFQSSAAEGFQAMTLTGEGDAQRVLAVQVTGDFFPTMGVAPAAGRALRPDDAEAGHDKVVVLAWGTWQRLFGGSRDIIGKAIQLDDRSYQVVGVMPASFKDFFARRADFWTPLVFPPEAFAATRLGNENLSFVARLAPGVSVVQAQAKMRTLADQMKAQYPDAFTKDWTLQVTSLGDDASSGIRTGILLLFGAVAFVLLIACANVANLQLARTAARTREVAVRVALGASPRRLMQHLLTESIVLAVAGGALGILLAMWGVPALLALTNGALPGTAVVRMSGSVLIFAIAVSLGTGVIFGMMPARQMARNDLHGSLKEGGRGAAGDRANLRLRRSLVVSTVALALTLLIGAGLLIRSFGRLVGVDPGFNPDHVLTFTISLPQTAYPNDTVRTALWNRLTSAIATTAGVRSVGATSNIPFGGNWSTSSFNVEGVPRLTNGAPGPWGDIRIVTPDFLPTMQARLIEGRQFTDADRDGAPLVAIVDDQLAHRYWPNADAIGKRITYDNLTDSVVHWIQIVGVVGHLAHEGLDASKRTQVYLSAAQAGRSGLTFAVRTSGDPLGAVNAIRSVVQSVDPNLAMANVNTMTALVESSTGPRRFAMLLLGGFAALALTLAAIGLYGVMSYTVTQRTRELGVRVALGAEAGQVLGLVLGQGLRLALIGVGIGLVTSLLMTRFLSGLLYDLSTTDPTTFAVLSALLVLVALLASYLPARRATKVDPMVALRAE